MEEWKVIPSHTNYEVSNLGRIRRCAQGVNTSVGRIKTPSKNNVGYMIFGAFSNGSRKNVFVHRAVAEAFIGNICGMQINHLDGNKTNNVVSNLEIVTPQENMAHASKSGLVASGDRLRTDKCIDAKSKMSGNNHWTKRKPNSIARGDNNGARLHPEKIERGEDRHCAKLTECDVIEIRRLHSLGCSFAELGRKFGITPQNARFVSLRMSWRHIQ